MPFCWFCHVAAQISMKLNCSNLKIITAIFQVSEYLGILRYWKSMMGFGEILVQLNLGTAKLVEYPLGGIIQIEPK